MDLRELLQTTVMIDGTKITPEFRIAVQCTDKHGWVHIIVHALGHNSETLDLMVGDGNQVMARDRYAEMRQEEAQKWALWV